MNRTITWTMGTALSLGFAAAGCQSNGNPPAGENPSRAGTNSTLGGDTAQPGGGSQRENSVGSNGEQLPMHGLH